MTHFLDSPNYLQENPYPWKPIARILAEALDDPLHSPFCSSILFSCVLNLIYNKPEISRSTQNHLLDSIMRFLNTEISGDRLFRIAEHLDNCSCQIRPHSLSSTMHEVSNIMISKTHEGPTIELIRYLFVLPHKALISANELKFAKGTHKRTWPTELSSLMPYGEDRFVSSMSAWTTLISQPQALAIISSAIRLQGRSLASKLVASIPFRDSLIETFQHIIECYKEGYVPYSRGGSRLFTDSEATPFYHPLSIVAELLRPLKENLLSEDHFQILFTGNIDKACRLLTDAMKVCSDSNLYPNSQKRTQRTAAAFMIAIRCVYTSPSRTINDEDVQAFFRISDNFINLIPDAEDPACSGLESDRTTALLRVGVHLKEMKLSTACSLVTCENSFQLVGRQFKKCSRCLVVWYCSRECQIEDWKSTQENGEYSHKTICPAIVAYTRASNLPNFLPENLDQLRAFDWDTAGDSVEVLMGWRSHYQSLREYVEKAAALVPRSKFSRKELITRKEEISEYLKTLDKEPGECFDT